MGQAFGPLKEVVDLAPSDLVIGLDVVEDAVEGFEDPASSGIFSLDVGMLDLVFPSPIRRGRDCNLSSNTILCLKFATFQSPIRREGIATSSTPNNILYGTNFQPPIRRGRIATTTSTVLIPIG